MGSANSKSPEAVADHAIHEAVNSHQVVVFSKRTCGYCDVVKHLLQQEVRRLSRNESCKVSDVRIIELDGADESTVNKQFALQRFTGVNTVPQVFINSRFVGGADVTTHMARAGTLRFALMEAARCPVPKDIAPTPASMSSES